MRKLRTNTQSMAAFLTFACALLIPAVHATEVAPATTPQDYATAKQAADADESSLDAGSKSAMQDKQRALLDAAASACATSEAKPDLSAFTIVMQLDDAGLVGKTWRKGDSPLALCIERYTQGKTVFVPPRNPFYSSLEISFEK